MTTLKNLSNRIEAMISLATLSSVAALVVYAASNFLSL